MKKQPVQKEQTTLGADVLRFVIGAIFVAMSLAFVTIPYALSSLPGDPPSQAAAAWRHLS